MAVGIDILEIERVKNLKDLEKIFTQNEIEYINKFANKEERICGLFCAKEAIFKSLNLTQLKHLEIEVLHNKNGAPYTSLSGSTLEHFKNNFEKIEISISHSKNYATAIAIATENNTPTVKTY